GLGTGPITLFGDETLKQRYLPRVRDGQAIAAFALSEKDAGSDVSAMSTTARRDGDAWVLDGEKTWISNAGIADHYVVVCRAPELGFARRALDEPVAFARERPMFGQRLTDLQLTQARLADMATEIDASALLVYRAAWTKDRGAPRVTREAAMAKRYATEAAQR